MLPLDSGAVSEGGEHEEGDVRAKFVRVCLFRVPEWVIRCFFWVNAWGQEMDWLRGAVDLNPSGLESRPLRDTGITALSDGLRQNTA